MKIHPMGNELFLADRQADGQYDANSSFRNFANASEKYTEFACCFFMDVKLVFVAGREKKATKLETS
jgi:hypothetical protein